MAVELNCIVTSYVPSAKNHDVLGLKEIMEFMSLKILEQEKLIEVF